MSEGKWTKGIAAYFGAVNWMQRCYASKAVIDYDEAVLAEQEIRQLADRVRDLEGALAAYDRVLTEMRRIDAELVTPWIKADVGTEEYETAQRNLFRAYHGLFTIAGAFARTALHKDKQG